MIDNILESTLRVDEDTLEILAKWDVMLCMGCIWFGHMWRDDVSGIDGTVCVRCGAKNTKVEGVA